MRVILLKNIWMNYHRINNKSYLNPMIIDTFEKKRVGACSNHYEMIVIFLFFEF